MPQDNPTKIDRDLEDAIRNAPSAEHVAQLLREAAVAQGLAQTDPLNSEIYTPTAQAERPQPQRFAKRFDGKIFEEDSELAVERAIGDYMRTKMAQPEARTEIPARDEQGRFVSPADQGKADENAFAKAELELRFKRGEISTEEYLTQSGAIASYLEKQGIPLEDLKVTVQEKQQEKMHEQSWADGVAEFLSGDGRDWPGGPELMEEAGRRIVALGLTNAPDKVAALAQVWNSIKADSRGLKNISEARTPEEIRDAAIAMRGGDSSIWGR
jgi:hypothetical protein